MIIQAWLFLVIFLIMAAFMAAIAFHVFRFRYHNDASVFVFSTMLIVYILVTALTLSLFHYSPVQSPRSNMIINNFVL